MSGRQLALDLFVEPAAAAIADRDAKRPVYNVGLGRPYTILCDGSPCVAGPIASLACAEAAVRALNGARS